MVRPFPQSESRPFKQRLADIQERPDQHVASLHIHLPREVLTTLRASARKRGVTLEEILLRCITLGIHTDAHARKPATTGSKGYLGNRQSSDMEIQERPAHEMIQNLLKSLRLHGVDDDLLAQTLAAEGPETLALVKLLAMGQQEIESGQVSLFEDVVMKLRERIRQQSNALPAESDGTPVGREFRGPEALAWLQENAEAIRIYNARVEAQGTLSEGISQQDQAADASEAETWFAEEFQAPAGGAGHSISEPPRGAGCTCEWLGGPEIKGWNVTGCPIHGKPGC